MTERKHNPDNEACPWNDPETFMNPATAGLDCQCPLTMSMPAEVQLLEIFDETTVLDQLNESLRLLLQCQPLFMCDKEVSISPHEEAKQAALASIAMLLSPWFEISEQGQ